MRAPPWHLHFSGLLPKTIRIFPRRKKPAVFSPTTRADHTAREAGIALAQLERYSEKFDHLDEFLSQLSLLAGQDAVGAARRESDKESITLSSIHQAKGLEWRAVFVVWLTEGMFPNSRVIEDDEDGGGLEEERRLFYVSVTRAKDELYLLYPLVWPAARNGDVLQRPSRFLGEIPSDFMEEWRVGIGW